MRPQGTPRQLEKRRRQAIQLLNEGKTVSAVARSVSASKSSVVRWRDAFKREGMRALRPREIPGRPARITEAQKARLVKVLLKGPLAAGYSTDLWTLGRIAEVIKRRFHIVYHPNHVWRLLRSLGWSCQKPERRALQRNEQEIAHWKRVRWPEIKKNRQTWCPPGVSG